MLHCMVTTVRLPEGLKAHADLVAAELGISLNALIAVALKSYLARQEPRQRVSRPLVVPVPAPAPPEPLTAVQRAEAKRLRKQGRAK